MEAARYLWEWFLMVCEEGGETDVGLSGTPDEWQRMLTSLTGLKPHPWEMIILSRLVRRRQGLIRKQNE